MIRLMHLADLHLGWEPKYLPDDKRKIRKKERDELLQKAVDIALSSQHNIDGVIIVGDLFEKYKPEDSLVRETLRQISRITASGMMVVTIPGNHDEITYRESVYRTHASQWPGHLVTNPMPEHCITHAIHDTPVYVYSLAYTGGLTKSSAINVFPRVQEEGLHIGAFHCSLDWDGLADRSLPLSSSKLSTANYHYIAMGHYHQFIEKNIGRAKAVYPGAVEFKSFNDPGTGRFTVFEWDGTNITIEKIPTAIREYEANTIDISLISSYDELKSNCLIHKDSEKIFKLTLCGTPRFHFNQQQLLEELQSSFFHLELSNTAQYFSEYFLETIINEPTVRGMYVKRMRQRMEEAQDEREKKVLQQALLQGLAALEGSEM